MKPVFPLIFCALLIAAATPAASQPIYEPGYDDGVVYAAPPRPYPPRPVVAPYEPRAAIVTTTRRIVTTPDEFGVSTTRMVTTTRKILREPEPLALYPEPRIVERPLPPPVRPVVVTKDPYGPPRLGPGYVVAPERLARPPVIVEERKVETIRRYVAPGELGFDD